MSYLFLSYPLASEIPVYGKVRASMELKEVTSIKKGDSSHSFWIGMNNHWGTHVDASAHFFEKAARASSLSAETWHFKAPQVISLTLAPGALVAKKDLVGKPDRETDLLLLKSGWWKKRGKKDYSLRNPGVLPETARWLRRAFPKLRAIGFDWVSVSSFLWRELGRQTHRAFLDPEAAGRPVLIFEDMDLSGDLRRLKEVWALPLRVTAADSAPCTVVGVCG